MGKYTLDALKLDLARLKQVGKKPMGFRPSSPAAEDRERRLIKKRLRANGFDVEVQNRVWVSLDQEEDE